MASKSETCPAEVGQGPNGAPEAQEQPLFIECASFEGAREGYVYKMDDAGGCVAECSKRFCAVKAAASPGLLPAAAGSATVDIGSLQTPFQLP